MTTLSAFLSPKFEDEEKFVGGLDLDLGDEEGNDNFSDFLRKGP